MICLHCPLLSSYQVMLWSWRLTSLWRVMEQPMRIQSPSWPTLLTSIVTTLWTNGCVQCWPLEKVLRTHGPLQYVSIPQVLMLCVPAGMKLDFKTLRSVGLSLDLLSQKSKNSSRGINRPVWVNADILLGPNVPAFLPIVNGTRWTSWFDVVCLSVFAVQGPHL